MTKTLSLIIPTYNMENYLRHTLNSLLVSADNMNRLEILVINDGSNDSSISIAREYETLYPHTFRAIDKSNGNYGSCINRGLQEATGKYVKVLDADDSFDTKGLDNFITFLSNTSVDLVLSDFVVVNENNQIVSSLTYNLPTYKIFSLKDIPAKMSNWIFHQVITYKTEIVRSIDYKQTEGISYTDDEWALEPMMNVKRVVYYPETIYRYLRGRDGQTCDEKVIRRTLQQRIIVVKSLLFFYKINKNKFSDSADFYITEKLLIRIAMVYNHYLTRSYSKKGMPEIIDFDNFLKINYPIFYQRLEEFSNSYKMHYIKQWRIWKYSAYCPALLIMRTKKILYKIIQKNINSLDMPTDLKRLN